MKNIDVITPAFTKCAVVQYADKSCHLQKRKMKEKQQENGE